MLSFDFMFTLTLDVVGPVYILVSFNARAIYGVLGVFEQVDVIYHPPKYRNCLPFELQCWATTHFKGFVELSSLPLYLGRFGGGKVV